MARGVGVQQAAVQLDAFWRGGKANVEGRAMKGVTENTVEG